MSRFAQVVVIPASDRQEAAMVGRRAAVNLAVALALAVPTLALWSPSSFATSIGAEPIDPVVAYIMASDHVDYHEAAARAQLEAHQGVVAELARGYFGNRMGGMYIADGRVLTISLLSSAPGDDDEFEKISASVGVDSDRLGIRISSTTDADGKSEVNAVSKLLANQLGEATSYSVAYQSDVQQVHVKVAGSETSRAIDLGSANRFKLPVVVETVDRLGPAAECNQTNGCDAPMRGGLTISSGCTIGFTVRSKSDAKWYALTAGHCVTPRTLYRAAQNSASNTNEYHNVGDGWSTSFGTVWRWSPDQDRQCERLEPIAMGARL